MAQLYGNAVVGQSGGPTTAINATLAGVIAGALECSAIGKIYGMRNGVEGLLEERLIDLNEIFEGNTAVMLYNCQTKQYVALDTRAEVTLFLVGELKKLLGDENVVYG